MEFAASPAACLAHQTIGGNLARLDTKTGIIFLASGGGYAFLEAGEKKSVHVQ
jgi:hypothetical protein